MKTPCFILLSVAVACFIVYAAGFSAGAQRGYAFGHTDGRRGDRFNEKSVLMYSGVPLIWLFDW